MGIYIVGSSGAVTPSSASSLVVPVPAGVLSGHVMYMVVRLDFGGSETIDAISGWDTIYSNVKATADSGASSLFRRVSSAEPADYTVTFSNAGRAAAAIIALGGVDSLTPEDDTDFTQGSSSTTSIVAPSVTAAVASLLLTFHTGKVSDFGDSNTWTPPAGMLEAEDRSSAIGGAFNSTVCIDSLFVASGATGTKTATASEALLWVAFSVVVNPRIVGPDSFLLESGAPDELLLEDDSGALLLELQSQYLVAGVLAVAETVFTPSIDQAGQAVASQLLSNSPVVSNPTVSPGAVAVVAQLLSQTPGLFDPNMPPVAQFVVANDIDLVPLIFDPATSPGAVTVVAQLINSDNSLFSAGISPGAVIAVAQLLSNGQSVFDPKVLQQISVPLLSNPGSLFSPQISQKILANLISQSIQIYNPSSIAQSVPVQLLSQLIQVFNPTLPSGAVTVVADRISQAPSLFDPKVLQNVVAQLLSNPPTANDPSVTAVARIIAQLIGNGHLIFDPGFSADSLIIVGSLDQVAAVQSPMVIAGSVTVIAESLAVVPGVYGPDVVPEQFVIVELVDNPATLNGPRVWLGIVPTMYQWNTEDELARTNENDRSSGSSSLKRTKDQFPTGQSDLKRLR